MELSAGCRECDLELSADCRECDAERREGNPISGLEPSEDIPIRKIELTARRQIFDAAHVQTEVEAVVFPPDAAYEIAWAAVTQTGVETNIARVTPVGDGYADATYEGNCGGEQDEGAEHSSGERKTELYGAAQTAGRPGSRRALVRVCGDGAFRLRCYSRNGKPDPDVISELEMEVTGLGSAVIDPYGALVKASLYNLSRETLDEVSEGGVKAGENRQRIVGFRNVSFGRAGSDRFRINVIHWHCNDPFSFSLWSGMPDEEGSEKLGDFTYQADFVWQTYISNSYRLEKKLKGMKDLCFVFEATPQRVYFGGFAFEGEEEAYAEISACEYSGIRGDHYVVEESAVRHIGNNVFMEFDGLDFTRGITSVTVKGKTHHARDSVHMRVVGEWGEKKEILEFTHTEEETKITFPVQIPAGRADVKFDFLPGCDFDLVSFRFEA